MKIRIDKDYMLKQLIVSIICLFIIIGATVILSYDNYIRYLGSPMKLLIIFGAMLLTYLFFAFVQGAITFSTGNTKDD